MNRSMLRLLSVVLASAVIALWPAAAGAQPSVSDPLIGTWVVAVTPAAGPAFSVISVFHSDGTYVHIDTNRNTALGEWVQIDGLKYRNGFQLFTFDQSGTYAGTTTVHIELALDESLDAFTGTYEFKIVDSNGKVTASGSGTRAGKRFTP
jgi:hypothetical protein